MMDGWMDWWTRPSLVVPLRSLSKGCGKVFWCALFQIILSVGKEFEASRKRKITVASPTLFNLLLSFFINSKCI